HEPITDQELVSAHPDRRKDAHANAATPVRNAKSCPLTVSPDVKPVVHLAVDVISHSGSTAEASRSVPTPRFRSEHHRDPHCQRSVAHLGLIFSAQNTRKKQ